MWFRRLPFSSSRPAAIVPRIVRYQIAKNSTLTEGGTEGKSGSRVLTYLLTGSVIGTGSVAGTLYYSTQDAAVANFLTTYVPYYQTIMHKLYLTPAQDKKAPRSPSPSVSPTPPKKSPSLPVTTTTTTTKEPAKAPPPAVLEKKIETVEKKDQPQPQPTPTTAVAQEPKKEAEPAPVTAAALTDIEKKEPQLPLPSEQVQQQQQPKLPDISIPEPPKLPEVSLEAAEDTAKLRAQIAEIQEKYTQQLASLKAQFEEAKERMRSETHSLLAQQRQDLDAMHVRDLEQQYRSQENLYRTRLEEELKRQQSRLFEEYRKDLKIAIGKERSARLAKLELLAMELHALEQSVRSSQVQQETSKSLRQFIVAFEALRDVLIIDRNFERELSFVRQSASSIPGGAPLVMAALDSIPLALSRNGVESPAMLTKRFPNVRMAVLEASFVTPDGGMWSHLVSKILAKFFSVVPHGYVEGDSVEAITARAEYFCLNSDLESAAREMNQLTGRPKLVAHDWLEAARQFLQASQALQVVEAEIWRLFLENIQDHRSA